MQPAEIELLGGIRLHDPSCLPCSGLPASELNAPAIQLFQTLLMIDPVVSLSDCNAHWQSIAEFDIFPVR